MVRIGSAILEEKLCGLDENRFLSVGQYGLGLDWWLIENGRSAAANPCRGSESSGLQNYSSSLVSHFEVMDQRRELDVIVFADQTSKYARSCAKFCAFSPNNCCSPVAAGIRASMIFRVGWVGMN